MSLTISISDIDSYRIAITKILHLIIAERLVSDVDSKDRELKNILTFVKNENYNFAIDLCKSVLENRSNNFSDKQKYGMEYIRDMLAEIIAKISLDKGFVEEYAFLANADPGDVERFRVEQIAKTQG